MIECGLVALLASLLAAWLIILTEGVHGRHTSDTISGSPQKINPVVVPRIGGIAILAGFIAGALMASWKYGDLSWWLLVVLVSLPAFAGGLIEDLTKNFSVYSRLLTTFISAGIGFFLLDARVSEVQVTGVDFVLAISLVSFAFTLLAVGGFAHAINIVDGFNGLSGGIAVLMLASMAAVAFVVKDLLVLSACAVLGGAILGFLVFNYPRGLIFAGDSGAYLMGFLIAELAVMLVHRNSEVSPWFPLLLLYYPVWETLFSAYRRKAISGKSPGAPDALHLHTLVYRRLVRWMGGARTTRALKIRNSLTTPYLWVFALLTIVPAAVFWDKSNVLQAAVIMFSAIYLWIYARIVRFRTPKFLIIATKSTLAKSEAVEGRVT